ncbi:MAG: TlpA family protein disulfide reductase [Gemmatimonadetes bacterium]|nr:MAG: TlpA family protein disulfide reductase [Gemmatimonadota bacterium]
MVGVGGPGTALPAFRAVTLAGDTLDSGDFEGRVVVVNFWATWCAPCRWEMPALQKLHEERKERGLILLGISRDGGGAEGAVRAFLDERGVTYPVTIDDGRLARAFGGLRGLPTTLIVDRRGVVRHRVYGYFAPAALRVAVDRLLDEPLR